MKKVLSVLMLLVFAGASFAQTTTPPVCNHPGGGVGANFHHRFNFNGFNRFGSYGLGSSFINPLIYAQPQVIVQPQYIPQVMPQFAPQFAPQLGYNAGVAPCPCQQPAAAFLPQVASCPSAVGGIGFNAGLGGVGSIGGIGGVTGIGGIGGYGGVGGIGFNAGAGCGVGGLNGLGGIGGFGVNRFRFNRFGSFGGLGGIGGGVLGNGFLGGLVPNLLQAFIGGGLGNGFGFNNGLGFNRVAPLRRNNFVVRRR